MGVSARAGQAFPANGVGTPMLGVDLAGNLAPLRGGADPATTNEIHVPAAATAAVLTFNAETDTAHVIYDVAWSYSGAPTGGRLTIADGSDTILDLDITAAGPGSITFGRGKQGHAGRAMTITLASGAGAVVGKLNASHGVAGGVTAGGAMDFSDEMNSGLFPLFF